MVDAEGDRQPSAGESDKPEQRLPVDLLLPLMHFIKCHNEFSFFIRFEVKPQLFSPLLDHFDHEAQKIFIEDSIPHLFPLPSVDLPFLADKPVRIYPFPCRPFENKWAEGIPFFPIAEILGGQPEQKSEVFFAFQGFQKLDAFEYRVGFHIGIHFSFIVS
ncbi:hypothetical protein [Desulfuromonas sp. TF]|uniref:hypothetical protein n=1 Tax=Desulfuromonas sp. TF TaxID=1232410 RepID=UPI0012DCAFD9|nr:hypothetical protein [Desulfuromonas sp. TF]